MTEKKNKRLTIHQLKKKKHKSETLQEIYLNCVELENKILVMQAVIDFKPNTLNLQLLRSKIERANIDNSEELNFYLKNPRQLSIDGKILDTYQGKSENIKLNLDHLEAELKNNQKNLQSKLSLAQEILRNIHLELFPVTEKNDKKKENRKTSVELEATTNIKAVAPIRISPRESWRLLVTNTKIPDGEYSIDWGKLKFGDGFIKVNILSHVLNLHSISSKDYLNNIKDKYIFSETPKIIVSIENGQGRVVNEHVLNYHITYFEIENLNNRGNIAKSFELFKIRGQNVRIFASQFPHYFKDKCFQFLCFKCRDDDKIFPLHERVIHSNQSEKICESFLFPFKGRISNYVIWESVYESRATYIFDFEITDFLALKKLFIFLTGETINKRENLRSSPRLQENLHYLRMIPHADFKQWKWELERI